MTTDIQFEEVEDDNRDWAYEPLPGDVIFTTGNSLIKKGQKYTLSRFARYTHVAIVTGSTQVCEAMIDRKVMTHDLFEWSRNRFEKNIKETKIVLRNRKWDLGKNIVAFERSVGFHLHEDYDLSVLWSKTKLEGISICSSLVLNILLRSGMKIAGSEKLKRAPTPAKLFKLLKNSGFEEMDYSRYENAARGADSAFDALHSHEIVLMLSDVSSAKAELVEKLWGWSDVANRYLTKASLPLLLHYMQPNRESIFDVIGENATSAHRYAFDFAELDLAGDINWQLEFKNERNRQMRCFKQGVAEHLQLLFAVFRVSYSHLAGIDEGTDRATWLKQACKVFNLKPDEAPNFFDHFVFQNLIGKTPAEVHTAEDFKINFPIELREIPTNYIHSDQLASIEKIYPALVPLLKVRATKLALDAKYANTDMRLREAQISTFRDHVMDCWSKIRETDDVLDKKLHENLFSYLNFMQEHTPIISGDVPFPGAE